MGGGRQAKLTGGVTDSGSSLKETRPSPFAEVVAPVIPEFSAEGKKPSGRGRGKVKAEPKAEPKAADDGSSPATVDDPKQKKLKFKVKDEEGGNSKKPSAAKSSKTGGNLAKKRKVKEMLDSFIISSGSDGEGEEEEVEIEKKSLRERIELRKPKSTDYKETMFSGDESVESEGSWKSGGDAELDTPPVKKVKTGSGAGKGQIEVSEDVSKPLEPAADEAKAQSEGKEKKKKTVLKPSTKAAAKPAAKKVAISSGSSGEKKKPKTVLGKKSRVVSHDISSDDESDGIQSASDSDSFTLPAKKKVATEVSLSTVCTLHTQ